MVRGEDEGEVSEIENSVSPVYDAVMVWAEQDDVFKLVFSAAREINQVMSMAYVYIVNKQWIKTANLASTPVYLMNLACERAASARLLNKLLHTVLGYPNGRLANELSDRIRALTYCFFQKFFGKRLICLLFER